MERKSIIQGRLEFGSEKSFTQALRMYEYRVDNFYKNDLLFKDEIFDEENQIISIPRLIAQEPEKLFNNSVKLLEYLSQFALSGSIGAWLVHEGKILKYALIEPASEKAVVQNFRRGQRLADEAGKEQEALKALTEAINKHDKHAQAYERRGYVNYQLDNMAGALYDFNKCISYDPTIPSAYFWRAKVHIRKDDFDAAIADLLMTTKKAIALQPIYWRARQLKARCHTKKKEYEEAVREYKLITKRKFQKDDPNYNDMPRVYFEYAQVLKQLGRTDEALQAIDHALDCADRDKDAPLDQLLTMRGKLKHESGESGVTDWQKAADLGSEEAVKLLSEKPA
ncbi:MAG: tetratricopeptide repeat protein [Saprospiraceae bacterium]|nr:tetratricopeptide repeat protein [Saprospiraceae bacterium]